jgi:phage terminase large subunit GpA-like protein
MVYELDLTRIQGNGDFPCPKCGIIISPDNETDEVYCILKIKERNKILEEVIMQCNKCATKIRLTGFSILSIE